MSAKNPVEPMPVSRELTSNVGSCNGCRNRDAETVLVFTLAGNWNLRLCDRCAAALSAGLALGMADKTP